MARDTRSLLDAVGWTAPQSVHVVGISMGASPPPPCLLLLPLPTLSAATRQVADARAHFSLRMVWMDGQHAGGMISLELARLCGERMRSLTLCVTSSGHGVWRNLPPVRPCPASFPLL